jgi:hypothetical protein
LDGFHFALASVLDAQLAKFDLFVAAGRGNHAAQHGGIAEECQGSFAGGVFDFAGDEGGGGLDAVAGDVSAGPL